MSVAKSVHITEPGFPTDALRRCSTSSGLKSFLVLVVVMRWNFARRGFSPSTRIPNDIPKRGRLVPNVATLTSFATMISRRGAVLVSTYSIRNPARPTASKPSARRASMPSPSPRQSERRRAHLHIGSMQSSSSCPTGRRNTQPSLTRTRPSIRRLPRSWRTAQTRIPSLRLAPGYSTNQALGYNYRYWHQMFNDRQLLCLSILGDRIRSIPDPGVRDLFTCLFSGTLEFNNMFASYKGEGTGAVRHMFAHHILKPERLPLEANVWGTAKSSGSFRTMFEGRILRALDYAEDPFELRPKARAGKKEGEKVYDLSERLGFDLARDYREFSKGKRVYLSCGDSSHIDLDDKSVDAVVTDPPFFDNVHYSQLADFFYVWQRHILDDAGRQGTHCTTRSDFEVAECRCVSVHRAAGRRLVRSASGPEGLGRPRVHVPSRSFGRVAICAHCPPASRFRNHRSAPGQG